MSTTKIKFSPSINIIRDREYEFNYISTLNAETIFNKILNDSLVGVKCHLIVGAYGTGKSSFLLAFQQTLEGRTDHFKSYKTSKQYLKYEFISLVGEYSSLTDSIAEKVGLNGTEYTHTDVIRRLNDYCKFNDAQGKGTALIIDEFGKFLEYAAKNNPESELYFIQQVAELFNDTDSKSLLITTLHQDFNAYSLSLNKNQQQEWDKVKGRLKEIVFNEPVEQLLFLAAEQLNQQPREGTFKNFDKLFDAIAYANAFPLRDYFTKGFAKELYPFDILSAAVLTVSLQKYGQNERSLFSFIQSNDPLGIKEFEFNKDSYYSIAHVYDYLLSNYYSFITTKYNPHYSQWSSIRKALERIEGVLKDTDQVDAVLLVKTIGLLNLVASASAKLDHQFYASYGKYALGIKNPAAVIKQLEGFKIIRFVNHSYRYILFEGTDLDIELAIDDAGRLVERVTNVANTLNHYFEFPCISAKASFYKTGTPRIFQFKLSEEPVSYVPDAEVDGFINLVFNDDTNDIEKIKECSVQCQEAILYGFYTNTAEIKNLLFEIQKVKKVIEVNPSDKVAIRELQAIQEHYIRLLNHYVMDSLYENNGNITWFYKGQKEAVSNRQSFNQLLSKISTEVYFATPVFKNELLNKTKISGQIANARKTLLNKLLTDSNLENLGFDEYRFPPEKTIYLSLLKNTGIHGLREGTWCLGEPQEESFNLLWKRSIQFLNNTKNKERNLREFIEAISVKPLKLKQGLIDYWVPIFLIAKNEEFALYDNNGYVPEISTDILDLINKKPGMFKIKAFDVVGIKLELFNRYRILLSQPENSAPNNKSFIQTIKPFLVFYRELPEYSRRTTRLDKFTLALRNVISSAKDPEKTFFDDFPAALGYSLQEIQTSPDLAEAFIKKLQNCVKKLRGAYDELLNRFEYFLLNEILGSKSQFHDYKNELKNRFQGIKEHMLLQHQKVFLSRVMSQLDDRSSWLSSLGQASLGKPLTNISDEEEAILHEKVKDTIHELDNLCELSKVNINTEHEDVIQIEITSLVQGLNKNLIRIPKTQVQGIENKVLEIKSILGKDSKLNLTILTKLIQDILNE